MNPRFNTKRCPICCTRLITKQSRKYGKYDYCDFCDRIINKKNNSFIVMERGALEGIHPFEV